MLAGFHRRAAKSVEIDEFGKPEKFKVNTDENFEQVEKYIGITISKSEFDAINRWTENFFETNQGSIS